MGEELIVVSIISMIGMIIITQLWQMNWFKRENFKITKTSVMAENRVRLKKLERDLGLKNTPEPKEPGSNMDLIKNLLPVLKNLDGDQIMQLSERFLGGSEAVAEGGGDVIDMLGDVVTNNPELVQSFLKGLKGGKTPGETTETGGFSGQE